MASFYPHLYQTVLALLVEARECRGLSQAELAERFGLTEQFVISYEDGSRLLDPAEYLAICRAIGIDPYRVLRDAERSAAGDACG